MIIVILRMKTINSSDMGLGNFRFCFVGFLGQSLFFFLFALLIMWSFGVHDWGFFLTCARR